MDALAAGGDLHAAEEQVERECVVRVLRVVHGVEGALFRGIVRDEREVRPRVLPDHLGDFLLLLRLQVVGVADAIAVPLRRALLGLPERQGRNAGRVRQLDAEQRQLLGVLRGKQAEHRLQQRRLHLHDVRKAVDEPHLEVQGGVFVQVPGRGVLFRAEDRADLEHAVVDADHGLLVELRRLRQVRPAAEVVELEDVRAALGARADDLGRVDLGEALAVQEAAEAPDDPLLHLEERAAAQGAQRQRPHLQVLFQGQVQLVLVDGQLQPLQGAGEDPRAGQAQLEAVRRARVKGRLARECDAVPLRKDRQVDVRARDALHRPLAPAQDHKGEVRHAAHVVHAPLHFNGGLRFFPRDALDRPLLGSLSCHGQHGVFLLSFAVFPDFWIKKVP